MPVRFETAEVSVRALDDRVACQHLSRAVSITAFCNPAGMQHDCDTRGTIRPSRVRDRNDTARCSETRGSTVGVNESRIAAFRHIHALTAIH